eukprot:3397637-Pleurochrysis_carterae.AAC.3
MPTLGCSLPAQSMLSPIARSTVVISQNFCICLSKQDMIVTSARGKLYGYRKYSGDLPAICTALDLKYASNYKPDASVESLEAERLWVYAVSCEKAEDAYNNHTELVEHEAQCAVWLNLAQVQDGVQRAQY